MSDKFINSSGLTYLWNKLTRTLASHGKSGNDVVAADKTAAIPFGIVDSTSTSTKYTATVDGITELVDGTCVLLKNSVVTSAANFTININNLGAKPSYNNMATGNPTTPTEPTRDTTIFNINYTMLFIYSSTLVDGGAWICYRGYDANTNTLGYQLRTNSYILNASDGFRYYVILFTSADGTKWVPANSNKSNSATTAKTVNQTPINPFGEIVYCGNSTNYSEGSAVTATAIWQQYTVTLGYSFNRTGAALTLTTKKPVYIKCAPQTNGSAIIDSTTPYVQDLPTTDDGKIYILLGMAYSATAIELLMNHPIYYHKDGAIRVWTNAVEPEGGEMYFETAYADLVAARNNNELVAGAAYRITDYVTTTTSVSMQSVKIKSAGHPFDIVVWALDDHTLSGDAKAIRHEGDTYFSASKLESWELKYCLDNDTSKFAWAKTPMLSPVTHQKMIMAYNTDDDKSYIYVRYPSLDQENNCAWVFGGAIDYSFLVFVIDNMEGLAVENILYTPNEDVHIGDGLGGSLIVSEVSWDEGKGVIYYMKDEYDNECPYDFKNIQFLHFFSKESEYIWSYTFSYYYDESDMSIVDASIKGNDGTLLDDEAQIRGVCHNVIKEFKSFDEFYANPPITLIYPNDIVFMAKESFESGPYYGCSFNSFESNCFANTFRESCHGNKFGEDCSHNSFGNYCENNTFGFSCYNNSFGNSCLFNVLGDICRSNHWDDSCSYNTLGQSCSDISFMEDCTYNSFVNDCQNIRFGISCRYNWFGSTCFDIVFGSSSNNVKGYYQGIIVDGVNHHLYLNSSATTSSTNKLRNIKIAQGVNDTDTYKTITHATVNDTFQTIYRPTGSTEVNV